MVSRRKSKASNTKRVKRNKAKRKSSNLKNTQVVMSNDLNILRINSQRDEPSNIKNNSLGGPVAAKNKIRPYALDFQDEELDFEPDIDDYTVEPIMIHSDQSTVRLTDFENKDNDSSIETVPLDNILSASHSQEMFTLRQPAFGDGRQNDYLPVVKLSNFNSRNLIDSSSESSSCSEHPNCDKNENNIDEDIEDYYDTPCDPSECNLTAEEEDNLLQSSDEEEETIGQNCFQNKIISVSNNNRIIIKAFTNPNQNKQLLIERSVTGDIIDKKKLKVQTTVKPARRKWNRSFRPSAPPVRLFLNDIGYTSPRPDSALTLDGRDCGTSSSSSSHEGATTMKSFQVTFKANRERVCERIDNVKPKSVSDTGSEDGNFKMPFPPAKRPPSRPKRSASSSDSGESSTSSADLRHNLNEIMSVKSQNSDNNTSTVPLRQQRLREDDVISLAASSIGDNVDSDIQEIKRAPSLLTVDDMEDDDSIDRYHKNRLDHSNKSFVEDWIRTVPSPTLADTEIQKDAKTPLSENDLIVRQPAPNTTKGKQRISFRDVPALFGGLCYFYYINGNCCKAPCYKRHSVLRDKYAHKSRNSTEEVLTENYQFMLNYHRLYKEMYPSILEGFAQHKMQNQLISCIRDFFKLKKFVVVVDAVDLVIKALEETGLSFLEAIEKISFNIGFMQYPELADILLDLITKKPNISENWEVVKRIAKARGHLSPKVVERIVNNVVSSYPVDRNLCLDIYSVISTNQMTNLAHINEELLTPLKTMVLFRDNAVDSRASAHVRPNNSVAKPREYERTTAPVNETGVSKSLNFEPPASLNLMRRYDFNSGKVTASFNAAIPDSDDRQFLARPINNIVVNDRNNYRVSPVAASAFSDNPSTSSSSEMSSSCHEPPEVNRYIPEIIQPQKVTLFPKRPIVGKPQYHRDFTFESSLHNLCPVIYTSVNISENDVVTLNQAIRQKNGALFLQLLEACKDPATVQNFITMTIATLKAYKIEVYNVMMDLLEAIGIVRPDYMEQAHIKLVFEVVVFNILFDCERKCFWKEARKLLELFCDWDSLISSQLLQIYTTNVTQMGRYIFLAKLLAMGKNFYYAYELLRCPSLCLLESVEKWPYAYSAHGDLEKRNYVLDVFFTKAYHQNIVVVADMYMKVFKNGGIHNYDAHYHFNPMLISIINDEKISLLKHLFINIDTFYMQMDKNVLQAFTISLQPHISQDAVLRLYEMCCDRNIYARFKGNERNIIVRTNMLDVELDLILHSYFDKLSRTNSPPRGGITIDIKLQERETATYPNKSPRSILDINEAVKRILKGKFNIFVKDTGNSKSFSVEISDEQIVEWLRNHRRW